MVGNDLFPIQKWVRAVPVNSAPVKDVTQQHQETSRGSDIHHCTHTHMHEKTLTLPVLIHLLQVETHHDIIPLSSHNCLYNPKVFQAKPHHPASVIVDFHF